jgi:hypothetical protein
LVDLKRVWEHCEREGVLDPGAFPVAPELVEAFVELHELDAAQAVTEQLGRLAANQQEHPWATATAKRCGAIVMLGRDSHDVTAPALLGEASDDFDRLGLRFDAARCLLGLGRARRRSKQWRAAREARPQPPSRPSTQPDGPSERAPSWTVSVHAALAATTGS